MLTNNSENYYASYLKRRKIDKVTMVELYPNNSSDDIVEKYRTIKFLSDSA